MNVHVRPIPALQITTINSHNQKIHFNIAFSSIWLSKFFVSLGTIRQTVAEMQQEFSDEIFRY